MTATMDPFTQVLGGSRGALTPHVLQAPGLTRAGKAFVKQLQNEPLERSLHELLTTVYPQRPLTPLQRRLIASLAQRVTQTVQQEQLDWAVAFADASGVRTSGTENVMAREGILHILPFGHRHRFPLKEQRRTACGMDINGITFDVLRRGAWANPGSDHRYISLTHCPGCALHEAAFTECQESEVYPPLPAPKNELLQRRVQQEVTEVIARVALRQEANESLLLERATVVYRNSFTQALGDLAWHRRGRMVADVLGNDWVFRGELQRQTQLRDLHRLLTREAIERLMVALRWQDLIDPGVAYPPPPARARPSARSFHKAQLKLALQTAADAIENKSERHARGIEARADATAQAGQSA